ncbi:MAG TPA: hypothetical protein VK155_04620 [Bacteroidales bacterium]|jgi:hypothetical protein|nr:hypothetical protein [Bacteroidales bacterium]
MVSSLTHTDRKVETGPLEYAYVLMLMFYAARAIRFFESPLITENPIGVLLPVIFSGIMAFKWKLYITKEFYALLFIFLLYFLAISIKFYDIQPTFVLTYYFLFFTAYVAIRVLKLDIFFIYEKILYYFAILSLFLWGIQVAAGGDFLFNIFSRLSFLQDISYVSGNGLSIVVYSIQPYETTLINEHTIARNCGFAWEPGSYASYLAIGLFINLFMVKDDADRKKRFIVLMAALLSTLSTTGYVIMILILSFYFFNKDIKKILLMAPVVIAVVIIVFSLPFMKDKIVKLMNETDIDYIVSEAYARENPATPQRFTSFLITMVDFKNNPVLGLAAHSERSWTRRMGSRISPISGIGNLMAQFGLVGIIPFLVLSIQSSFMFARIFKYRGKFLLFLIIIGISISYSIVFIPFFMCFWMLALFEPHLDEEPETGRIPALETSLNQNNNF